jgi:4-hydroxybenzoate polyprenyltransferase
LRLLSSSGIICNFILAPVGAYLAVTGVFNILPILLGVAVLTWVAGFDVVYALQDEAFDKAQKLHSIPVLLGTKNAIRVSNILHCITAIIILSVGIIGNLHWLYWIAAAIFIILLIAQHRLVKPNDLSKINLAFFTTNGIGSVSFATLVIIALYLK